jgi:hypothetical protein
VRRCVVRSPPSHCSTLREGDRRIKNQSRCCLGSAFKVAACQTLRGTGSPAERYVGTLTPIQHPLALSLTLAAPRLRAGAVHARQRSVRRAAVHQPKPQLPQPHSFGEFAQCACSRPSALVPVSAMAMRERTYRAWRHSAKLRRSQQVDASMLSVKSPAAAIDAAAPTRVERRSALRVERRAAAAAAAEAEASTPLAESGGELAG